MQITYVIEPIAGNGYLAKTGEPLPLRAEGATPEEAEARLRILLDKRVKNGTRIGSIDVPSSSEHPLAKFAGMFKDDPGIDDWIADMAEYRRQIDSVADQP